MKLPLAKVVMFALVLLFPASALAQSPSYVPELYGTFRARYEYAPTLGKGRFQVRNARVGVTGNIISHLIYRAQVDLCAEGSIKMLDAYVRYAPERWSASFGQMRIPFTIDAHRSPHLQYFANRSFIAKAGGSMRDVGVMASFNCLEGGNSQIKLEGGIFNGSGLTNQKDYWTSTYNYALKALATIEKHYVLQASCSRLKPENVGIFSWDVGAYFDNSLWHIECEYLRKSYQHGAFQAVNAVNAFVCRTFPINNGKSVTGISALARYDYMSANSDGKANAEGLLTATNPERQRLTLGATLRIGKSKPFAEVRLNYEKYFYDKGTETPISECDKIVAEIMVKF